MCLQAIEVLCSHGARVSEPDRWGHTPLDEAKRAASRHENLISDLERRVGWEGVLGADFSTFAPPSHLPVPKAAEASVHAPAGGLGDPRSAPATAPGLLGRRSGSVPAGGLGSTRLTRPSASVLQAGDGGPVLWGLHPVPEASAVAAARPAGVRPQLSRWSMGTLQHPQNMAGAPSVASVPEGEHVAAASPAVGLPQAMSDPMLSASATEHADDT
jgi:hypothetical protein